MKDQIIEIIYWLFGYRKPSLLGDSSDNTRTVNYGTVPRKQLNERDEIDLSGGVESNQGRHGSCACTTLSSIGNDDAIRQTRKKTLEFNWLKAWNSMISMGIADDKKGSYLDDNLWYAQSIGYEDNKGNVWKADLIEKIDKRDCEKFIRMGYQVYTGSLCGYPFCNSHWFFNVGQIKFGHAFRKIGLTMWNKLKICLNETTWLNYGFKKESQFFSYFENDNKLMSCYCMTWKKYKLN